MATDAQAAGAEHPARNAAPQHDHRPDTARSATVTPDAVTPGAMTPGALKPETAKSETAKPETAKSETAKSEIAKSETAKPGTAMSETVKPDIPRPDAVTPRPLRRALAQPRALWALFTGRPVSLYAAAALRIGYGFLYLTFLLREFTHREEIWGPDSPWTPELARQLFGQTGWASVLTLSDSHVYFDLCYAVALVTSALFLVGWRTRAVSVLFAVVVASFHARAIFMTDGGDNLILLMSVYLVLTASGRRWSLDARRSRLRGPRDGGTRRRAAARAVRSRLRPGPQLRDARRTLTTVLHNCGMLVIAAQVCVLYGCAGLYKVQGGTWGNGTALHYVLGLDLFRPWPALSAMADAHPVVIAVAGYATVLLQAGFPFVLFGRLKYPVLTLLLGMHLGIAVLMGLPLFSGAMITADAVFLPDRFWTALARTARGGCRRVFGRTRVPGAPGAEPPVRTPSTPPPRAAFRDSPLEQP